MQFPDRPGAVYRRVAARGCVEVVVYPLLFGGGRIARGARLYTGEFDAVGFDDGWDYQALDDALHAAHEWDGTGEPDGFYRRTGDQRKPVQS